jgi:DNA-binding transcriptional LysR family regulator
VVVDELAGLVRGRVAIGTVTSFSSDVPDLLAAFHGEHPEVEMTLVEATSDELVARLRAGELDLVLANLAGEVPAGVATEVVSDEPIVAVVAPDDELADRVPLRALGERAVISLPRGTGLRAAFDAACAAAGVRPRIAFEASDPYVLAQLAARGLGVAIVPGSLAAAHPEEVRAVGLEPELRGRLVLAWRESGPAGPAARALIARAREALPGHQRRGLTPSPTLDHPPKGV